MLTLVAVSLFVSASYGAATGFPYYQILKTNVTFWENIYGTYSINSAVIHDRNDLSKIYEVVQLMDKSLPAAARVNSTLLSLATDKYRNILLRLASGKPPATSTEHRVSRMFTGKHRQQYLADAADSVRAQHGQKERFYQGVIRSGRYLHKFRAIFQSYGLPPELAYLPHVESSFDNKAYSKAGASGMWQFTRGTGKQFMRIDDAVDERSDPFIAAEAAARYLDDSHTKLGSWPLALTAYNYGTAGMVRARDAKGSYERIFREYREGNFGFASQNFYAEFLAAMHVAAKIESAPGVRLDPPGDFVEYRLPGYLNIKTIRRHFSLSDELIKELNPALRRPIYTGHKLVPTGYPLRLPATKTTRTLIARLPHSAFADHQTHDRYHTVRPGESLSRLAAANGLSVQALAAANHLRHDAMIRIGQRLRIPPKRRARQIHSTAPQTITTGHNKRVHQGNSLPSQPLVISAEESKVEKITAN